MKRTIFLVPILLLLAAGASAERPAPEVHGVFDGDEAVRARRIDTDAELRVLQAFWFAWTPTIQGPTCWSSIGGSWNRDS